MEADTPEGTGNWERAPDDDIAQRIQAVLEPEEDNQGEDVEAEDVEAADTEDESPDAQEAEAEDPDEAPEETEETESEVPQTVKVKVDGQELDLPIEEVTKGYQRQADYTRKTQELAQQKQAMDQELSQSKAQYAQVIDQVVRFLDGQQAKAPDPSLAETDPYEYTRQLAVWNEHKARSDAARAEQQRLSEERKTAEQQRLRSHVAREQEILLEKKPEWRDEKVRKADQGKIRAFLKDFGVSDQELSDPYSVFQTDHRALLLAGMAMKAHEAQQLKPKAIAKAKGKPKVAKPGAARSQDGNDQYMKARGRLKKTGSLDDAAAALKHLL